MGEHRYSRTGDIVADDLSYIKIQYGLPIHQQNRLNIRLSGQFSRWSESYSATGVRQNECTASTHRPEARSQFFMSGDGDGMDFEVGLKYLAGNNLSVKFMYRCWVRAVTSETWESYPAG